MAGTLYANVMSGLPRGPLAATVAAWPAIDDGALAVIGLWLAERKRLGINGRSTLFCTLKGGPMSDRAIRYMLERRVDAKHADIGKKVRPHGLRHTMAVEWAGAELHRMQHSAPGAGRTGAVGDGGSGTAGWRPRRRSEPAGQDGRDRTVLRQMPGCCAHSGCVRRKHDAARGTKKRSDEADVTNGQSSR